MEEFELYRQVLRQELELATGCTEPIAIAYAAALARETLGCEPERLNAACSGNIVKNVKSVAVPGTGGLRGIEAAAVIGAVGGDAAAGLNVLHGLEDTQLTRAKELLAAGICSVSLLETNEVLHIRVEAEGVAVHGSTPELGENAIGRLAMALAQLPFTGETGECLAFVSERLGMETHGESLGLAMRDGISGDLTMNVGVASFENEALSLTFSVRYPVTLPYELVYPRLKRGFTLGGFTENEMTHAAAIYMPPESELIRRLSKVYEEQTGEKAELKSIGGGTYAKSMPNLVAFGPIFPGDEVREHKPDEYMEIERVLQNAEIIAAAMYELAK